MDTEQKSKFCKKCGKKTLHVRHSFSTGWGCALTLLTGGLFLLLWIPVALIEALQRYRCQVCGAKN